jgi:hypothetical protein
MIAIEELDRLLTECKAEMCHLSVGERRMLCQVLRLRRRHGVAVVEHLFLDDLELLEDWSAASSPVAAIYAGFNRQEGCSLLMH